MSAINRVQQSSFNIPIIKRVGSDFSITMVFDAFRGRSLIVESNLRIVNMLTYSIFWNTVVDLCYINFRAAQSLHL